MLAALSQEPGQDVGARMPGKFIRVRRCVPDLVLQRCRFVVLVALQGQARLQQAQAVAPVRAERIPLRLEQVQAGPQCVEIARVELHVGHHHMQRVALSDLLFGKHAHQAGHPIQLTARQQRQCASFHQARRGAGLACAHGMQHGVVDVAACIEPPPCRGMHRAHFPLAARGEMAEQRFAQQRMDPVPGLVVMAADDRDEQVVGHHPRDTALDLRDGLRLAQDLGAQRRTEALADGDAHQHVEIVRRQLHQYLALKEACKGARVADLRRRVAARLLLAQPDGQELQPGHPSVRQFVQGGRVAGRNAAELVAQETRRLLGREAQVAHAELRQQVLQAQPLQGKPQRRTRGQRHAQLRRSVVQQQLQRLQDAGVRDVVQVVDHQHQVALAPGELVDQRDDP
ncbi:hypothetical protein D9M68_354460 [compost metagenome]